MLPWGNCLVTRLSRERWNPQPFDQDRLNVYDHGTPADDLVMLLHGLGGSANGTWGDIPATLFHDASFALDVAMVDYPTAWRRIMNPSVDLKVYADQMAGQLAELIDDYATVTMVGHSMGGLMAKAIIARYGRRRGMPGDLAKLRLPSIVCIASPLAGAPKASFLPAPFNQDTKILTPFSDWIFDNNEFFVEYARPHNTARVTEDLPVTIPLFAVAGGSDPHVPIQSAFSGVPESQRIILAGDHSGVLKSPQVPSFIKGSIQKRKLVLDQERRNFQHSQSESTRSSNPPWVSHFLSDRSRLEWEEEYRALVRSLREAQPIDDYQQGHSKNFDSLVVVLDLSDDDWEAFVESACEASRLGGGAGHLMGVIGVNPAENAGSKELLKKVRACLGYGPYYTFTASSLDEVTSHMGTILNLAATSRPVISSFSAGLPRSIVASAFTSREF